LKSINERMSKARAKESELHGFNELSPTDRARRGVPESFLSLVNDALLEYFFKALFPCE